MRRAVLLPLLAALPLATAVDVLWLSEDSFDEERESMLAEKFAESWNEIDEGEKKHEQRQIEALIEKKLRAEAIASGANMKEWEHKWMLGDFARNLIGGENLEESFLVKKFGHDLEETKQAMAWYDVQVSSMRLKIQASVRRDGVEGVKREL